VRRSIACAAGSRSIRQHRPATGCGRSNKSKRALGKPKETVEHPDGETPVQRRLRQMSTDELEESVRSRRHLRPVDDEDSEAASS
jgi:hypothetical protein